MNGKKAAYIRSIILVAIMAAAIAMIAIRTSFWILGLGIVLAIVTFLYALWKNENFTHAANEGQRVTNWIKDVSSDIGVSQDALYAETALELQDGRGEE